MKLVGTKIGHYEMLARIGAGGMGEVYRARDLNLDREVAIKLLSSVAAGTEQVERLKREARTLAGLNHPNIVTVYSVEEEDGAPFLTMELLEGETLGTVLARGRIPQERFIDLGLQLLHGICAAHKQGVVHRDLKPANIMITSESRLKVLDFGIAKVLPQNTLKISSSAPDDPATLNLTQPGLIVGTMAYLSPEQAQGLPIDHRTDIFNLGLVLYQMGTGRHPFPGENPRAIMTSILRDAPSPIGEGELEWVRQSRRILERCLEKDPAKRYQHVSEVIDDFTALQESSPGQRVARSTEDLIRTGREALERHAWSRAFECLREADAEAQLSPDNLERVADAAWWTGKMEECCHLLERAYAAYVRDSQPRKAALMAIKLADIFFHRARRAVSAGWLSRAERLLRNTQDSVEYGYLVRCKAVVALEIEGDPQSALRLAEQTFDIGNQSDDKNLVALSTQDRGRALVDQGQVSEGMALLDEAMAAALSGELSPITVARTYCNMIAACQRTADYRRASEWTEEARHWCEPHGGSPFPGICSVHRAELKRLKGDLEEAESEIRLVCTDPRGYVDTAAAAYYEAGEIRLRMGDDEGAEEAFREAHERGRDPAPGLPMLLLARGQTDAAKSLITRALARTILPLDRAKLLPCHIQVTLAAADIEAAKPSIEELEQIAKQFGSGALEAAAAHARGSFDLAKGDFEQGYTSLEKALKLWLEIDLPYEAAMTRLVLAETYRAIGDEASADLELRTARSTLAKLGSPGHSPDFETQIG